MATSFTSIVAAKKLASIKKNYKLKLEDEEEVSPDSRRKLEEKIEKDQLKREKQEGKRQEQYDERERQREKLRSRIKEKYQIDKTTDEETKASNKGKKKDKKDLREKDFYKYNKAMPDEKGKKVNDEGGAAGSFSKATSKLNEKKEVKDKGDCLIS